MIERGESSMDAKIIIGIIIGVLKIISDNLPDD